MPPSPFYFKCFVSWGFACDDTGKSSGWSDHGGRGDRNQTFHYFRKTLKKHPPGYQVEKPSQICLPCLSWWKLGSLLQKGWQQKGLHWHCCQARFLLKFYSSVTNVFLSQLRVILIQAASGKGSPVLPSSVFMPPLLCQHQHFCAYETKPAKVKNPTYKLIFG